jgi:hypothetical protein
MALTALEVQSFALTPAAERKILIVVDGFEQLCGGDDLF